MNHIGTRLYALGSTRGVYYDLSVAWDLSSAGAEQKLDTVDWVQPTEGWGSGLFFADDGKMSVQNDWYNFYPKITATRYASPGDFESPAESVTVYVGSEFNPTGGGMAFNGDGTQLFIPLQDDDTNTFFLGIYDCGKYNVSGYTISLPSSVDRNTVPYPKGNRRLTMKFMTLDGGTNVYLTEFNQV